MGPAALPARSRSAWQPALMPRLGAAGSAGGPLGPKQGLKSSPGVGAGLGGLPRLPREQEGSGWGPRWVPRPAAGAEASLLEAGAEAAARHSPAPCPLGVGSSWHRVATCCWCHDSGQGPESTRCDSPSGQGVNPIPMALGFTGRYRQVR